MKFDYSPRHVELAVRSTVEVFVHKEFVAPRAPFRMDESALQHRLDAIERRQFVIVSLILFGYLIGGTWILVDGIDAVTPWNAGVGLTVLAAGAAIVGTYRRRRAEA